MYRWLSMDWTSVMFILLKLLISETLTWVPNFPPKIEQLMSLLTGRFSKASDSVCNQCSLLECFNNRHCIVNWSVRISPYLLEPWLHVGQSLKCNILKQTFYFKYEIIMSIITLTDLQMVFLNMCQKLMWHTEIIQHNYKELQYIPTSKIYD